MSVHPVFAGSTEPGRESQKIDADSPPLFRLTVNFLSIKYKLHKFVFQF